MKIRSKFFQNVVLASIISNLIISNSFYYYCKSKPMIKEKQIRISDTYKVQKTIKLMIEKQIEEEIEKEKKQLEEEKLKKKLEEEKKEKEKQTIEFVVTFYSDLDEENGTKGGVDCKGNKLRFGTIANNQLPHGTKVHLDNWGDFIVKDRGSKKHFNRVQRIDMFIPRKEDEINNDEKYKRRIDNMGKKIIKGHIIRKEGSK